MPLGYHAQIGQNTIICASLGTRDTTMQIHDAPDLDPQEEAKNMYYHIVSMWTASTGGTYLWEYIHHVLCGKVHSGDEEVVIMTDGQDNESDGKFSGIAGFDHMITTLKDCGNTLPRITVMCVGDVDCTSGYEGLSRASGGFAFSTRNRGAKGIEGFRAHMLSSHAERSEKA